MKLKVIALVTLLFVGTSMTVRVANAADNELTAKEKKEGWRLLFDGKSLQGWRSYRKPDGPKQGWVVESGILKCVAGAHGGDIITVDKYNDYELQWDWMIPAKANNGIKYLVTEERPTAPGQEYQMIDDAIVADSPKQSTAAFYDVIAPDMKKPLKPVGEWNHSRLVIQGNHVEHWLNGKNVLTYELGSPEVMTAVAASKFKKSAGFGEKIQGYIMLTEHHDEASYRNIKIRELTAQK
ncbi:3-keto-disaccharide hydrolase [Pedosphaera parvula]|uniref:3-keto-alpha-glucoside-1,2-lyase/3-keto-2-hydroxy-glucal hydratase domain-containing protein n=1 Tax=Pedosphaera parvula (strain Ellin514) TaxID=320771 RepID=B9XGW2_PEDPL|nr:DUF1080 domain-containing protein [Pedosphaera parvula]EEF60883.1 protein of unknown function DUF1080 [Pedosphaera parvula Ellin514]